MLVRPVLSALLLASALTACGGDDGVSKADYLAETEKICTAAKAEIDGLDADVDPADPASFGAYFDASLATADKYTQQLKAVEAPEADAEMLAADFIEPLEQQVDFLREKLPDFKAAVESEDPAALEALGLEELPEVDQASLKEYGLSEACLDVASVE